MIISEICIKRPVLATMMSLVIVLFGLVALDRLPVRELPDIDPPIITVTTVYPGADAAVVETEVTEKLEETINSIEGIKELTSESREQVSNVTIEFDLSRDIDLAAQDVRDRVSRVRGTLPDDIEEPIVAKQDADANPVIWIALFSARYTTLELTDLAENFMKDRLQTVRGVSSIFIGGRKRFAIRIRLDAEKMAAHGVTVLDIDHALKTQNVELPSGRIEGRDREMTIQTLGELKTADEFNRLVVKEADGAYVRIRDVGEAEVGVEDERSLARFNSKPAVGLGVVKQSKANTIEVARGIKAELERLLPQLPAGVETYLPYDESVYVEDSIHQVWITLAIAFALVVLTIFVFLRNVRSTLIPSLTIPVSTLGTFFVLGMMGYSVNILTMLALVLAIGVVVDDSIVVLENIYRHVEEGMAPMDAAVQGMREIAFAVIATTLALCAVFIPLAFQTTVTGRLFIEFAIALTGSVVISSFVALTFTPMVAARILRPIDEVRHGRVFNFFERGFSRFTHHYERMLTWSLRHRPTVVVLSLLLCAAAVWIYTRLPKDFLPEEDKGSLLTMAITPEGSTSEYTDRMLRKVEAIVSETPEVAAYFSAVGLSRSGPGLANQAFMFMRFKDDRDRGVGDIVAGPRGLGARFFNEVPGAFAIPIIPKAITRGFGQPFQLVIQDQDLEQLNVTGQEVANALRAAGYLMNVRQTFEINKPELRVRIERDRAAALGISVDGISRTLQILFGGLDLSTVKLGGKEYSVIAQLRRESRLVPADLDRLYVRNDRGDLIQISNVVRYEEGAGPSKINHFNRFRSATIEATPQGIPLGTAIERVESMLKARFPGVRTTWAGESADLKEAGQGFTFVVVLALIIVYMVLASQFESLLHPLTIMLTLPLAAIGAFGLLWVLNGIDGLGTGLYAATHYAPSAPGFVRALARIVPRIPAMNINLFSQIGLVLLIGLATKNSILLVEFANQQMARGKNARDAMLAAGRIRFRPILMTSFSTILGILPIAIGWGAGGESRRPMGVAAVGGLLTGTFLTLLLVPVVYTLFSDWGRRGRRGAGTAALVMLLAAGSLLALPAASRAELPGADVVPVLASDAVATRETALPAETEIADREPEHYDLARCLETALEHNYAIRKARERIARQQGIVLSVRARQLPGVSVGGQYARKDSALGNNFGGGGGANSDETWNLGIQVEQVLFAGRGNRADTAAERLLAAAAAYELQAAIQDALLAVRERYYDVLLARSRIDVQEENLRVLREELDYARNKLEAGIVSPFEALRAEVSLANGQTPTIRARNAYRLALEALAQAIGLSSEDVTGEVPPLAVDGELAMEPYTANLDDERAAARMHRPELDRLARITAARDRALDAAGADRLPEVAAFAGYGWERDITSDNVIDSIGGWRAGLSMSWDLFDGYATRGNRRTAAADMRIAALDLDEARLNIDVEVRQAHASLVEAAELVDATRQVIGQAEESLRLARSRYDAGAATQLDLLSSQAQLTQARNYAVEALHDYAVSLARLRRAMGVAETFAAPDAPSR